jgi:Meiotically up-regulated gene 113
MIYFLKNGDAVKIGYTENYSQRLQQLQTGSPHQLEFLGTMEGSIEDETALHARFNGIRIRGEWFRLNRALMRFIVLNTGQDHGEVFDLAEEMPPCLEMMGGSYAEVEVTDREIWVHVRNEKRGACVLRLKGFKGEMEIVDRRFRFAEEGEIA